jgi:enoyl-CoA hydratase/carnithine racemase
MSTHVEIAVQGAVQTLRLNRPDKKNALTGEMYKALADALKASDADPDIAVTVFLGLPCIFCAGNDLFDFLAVGQGAGGGAVHGFTFIQTLAEREKPLIAAADGPAVGIGTTLMLHCDLVFASPRAVFQTPFVNLGLVPEAGSSLLGPRVMGHARAFELLVMGEAFTADRAREAGFVNHVVPPEALESAAMTAAEALAAKPREAVRLARRLLKGEPAPVKARMEQEGALFLERIKSKEAMAAFEAFLQKAPKT